MYSSKLSHFYYIEISTVLLHPFGVRHRPRESGDVAFIYGDMSPYNHVPACGKQGKAVACHRTPKLSLDFSCVARSDSLHRVNGI